MGSYRPEEVSLDRRGERHPLAPVLDELKREYGQISGSILTSPRVPTFVDAFLRFGTESAWVREFRQMLYSAIPVVMRFFTVELLRDLQEQGDLIQDESGFWVESPTLEWDKVPARVEGVIAARIGRLEEEAAGDPDRGLLSKGKISPPRW